MNYKFKNAARHWLAVALHQYHQLIYWARWVLCILITLLVWGGAVWFGSLAWDQKQGAVLGLMGFAAWLAVFRFVAPGFWVLSKEVIKQLFRWINDRYL